MNFFRSLNSTLTILFIFFSLFYVPLWAQDRLSVSGRGIIPNRGQLADEQGQVIKDVKYYTRGAMATYFSSTGFSYVLSKTEMPGGDKNEELGHLPEKIKQHRIDITFENANPSPEFVEGPTLPYYCNFYYGHCPDGIDYVYPVKNITYKNVWPGIDIRFYIPEEETPGTSLEYDFVVRPGANPDDIRFHYKGATLTTVGEGRKMSILSPLGTISERIPLISQENKKLEGKYRFEHLGEQEYRVSFKVNGHNPLLAMVIDPWATYVGGTSTERSYDVATDGLNNVIITGATGSSDLGFPASPSVFQPAKSSNWDAFVAIFSTSGVPQWMTFYGGGNDEYAFSVATDSKNFVIVGGHTNAAVGNSFPVCCGPNGETTMSANPCILDQTGKETNHPADAFIVKLAPDGSRNWADDCWATLYGGIGNGDLTDGIIDVAVLPNDDVVAVGYTHSNNLWGTAPGSYPGSFSAFVAIFASVNGATSWATYLGGSGSSFTMGKSVAVDKEGAIIMTGVTNSATGIATAPPVHQGAIAGSQDLFIARYIPDAPFALDWCTYFGGSAEESTIAATTAGIHQELQQVATDSQKNIFLISATKSNNLATPGAYQVNRTPGNPAGGANEYDNILVKFNSAGALGFATYIGGSKREGLYGSGIGIDAYDHVLVASTTEGTGFTTWPNGVYQSTKQGTGEGLYLAKFDNDGNLLCGSYYGGDNVLTFDLALDPKGNINITGSTVANLPTFAKPAPPNSVFDPTYNNNTDAFVLQLCSPCGEMADNALISDKNSNPYPNTKDLCMSDSITLYAGIDLTTSRNVQLYGTTTLHDTIKYIWKDLDSGDTLGIGIDSAYVDSISPNGSVLKIKPVHTGVINLELTVAYGSCPVTRNITINVKDTASAAFTFGDTTICSGASIQLVTNFTKAGPWDLYLKTPSGSQTVSGIAVSPYTFAASAQGDYIIEKVGLGGCLAILRDTIQVTVMPLPTALISGGTNICPGDSVKIRIQLTGRPNWQYNWTYAGSSGTTTSTAADSSFVTKTAGTYKITFISDSMCSNTSNTSTFVSFITKPSASISNTSDTLYTCPYKTAKITFNRSGSGTIKLYYLRPGNPTPDSTVLASIDVNTEGLYKLVYVKDSNCDSVLADSIYIKHHPLPGAGFTVTTDTLCKGDSALYTLTLSGKGPFAVSGTANLGLPAQTSNSWTKWLKPSATAGYIVTKITDNSTTCSLDVALDTLIVVNELPVLVSSAPKCNAQSTEYTVTFTLRNGGKPYTVQENLPVPNVGGSWINDSVYVTNPIPSDTAYSFTFNDKNGCGPVPGDGKKKCNCSTIAGIMDITPQLLCQGQSTDYAHKGGQFLENGDTLEFLLHQNTRIPPISANLIARNNHGLFVFDASLGMAYGTTYYVTAVAGNKKGSTGEVDTTDACYTSTSSIPVTWFQDPTFSETHTDSLCPGDSALVSLTLTGSQSPFDVVIDGGRITLPNVSDGHSFKFEVNRDTCFRFTSLKYANAPGCLQSLADSVCVRTFDSPLAQNKQYTCNSTADAYQLSFTIAGGTGPFTVTGLPGNSTIAGRSFLSDWLIPGTTYTYTLDDAHHCNPETESFTHSCNCSTSAGTADTSSLDLCENMPAEYKHNADQTLDGNDTLEYVLHTSINPLFGKIITRNNKGVFPFDPGTMDHDSVYYITAIAGNKMAGDSVDMSDPCLSIGKTVRLIFRALPDLVSLTAAPNDSLCITEAGQFHFVFTGTGRFYLDVIGTNFPKDSLNRTDSVLIIPPPSATTKYTFTRVYDRYCSRDLNQSITITRPSIPLTVNATLKDVTCTGYTDGEINLTVSGGFGGYSYEWKNSSGTVIDTDASALGLGSGNYTVIVSDYLGCTTTASYNLAEPEPFNISFIDILNQTCFQQNDGKIKVYGQDGKSYTLDGDTQDTLMQDTAYFYELRFDPGTNILKIEATSWNLCKADSSINITGLDMIHVIHSPDQFVCPDTVLKLTASASGGNGNTFTYFWQQLSSGNWDSITGPDFTINPTLLFDTVVLYVKDNKGCPSETDSIVIRLPQPLTQMVSLNMDLCFGDPFTLITTATGGTGGLTYVWNNGVSNVGNNAAAYNGIADSTRTYTITTSDTCRTRVSNTIAVNVAQPVQVIFQAAPDTSGCAPLTVDLVNQSQGTFNRWQWRINSGSPITDTVLSRTFSNPGSYTIELELFNDIAGCTYKLAKPQYIIVHPVARAEFSYLPHDVTLIDPSIEVQNVSLNSTSYQWTLDSLPISTLREPEIRFRENEAAEYLLCLMAHTPFDCNDTSCLTIVVKDAVTVYVPSGFTPNDDGINDTFKAEVLGIQTEGFLFQVFDRWGEIIFATTDPQQGWDGRYHGEPVKSDVYGWKLKARAKGSAQRVDKTGKVLISR